MGFSRYRRRFRKVNKGFGVKLSGRSIEGIVVILKVENVILKYRFEVGGGGEACSYLRKGV